MKYSIVIYFALLFCLFSSCRDANTDSGTATENAKYINFVRAIENWSTFYYFTVVKVKDLNSGEIKEVCVDGNFVIGALYKELNKGYDSKGEDEVMAFAKARKNRYFEFRNKEALDNISFFDYDPELVTVVKRKYDFNKMLKKIKEKGSWSMGFKNNDEMKAFAHALFNEGYLTGENACFGGGLIYVSETDLKNEQERLNRFKSLHVH